MTDKSCRKIKLSIKKGLFLFVFTTLCVSSFHAASSFDSSHFYRAKVKDLSDRKYQSVLYGLLKNAKESIVVSMYLIKPYENSVEKAPVISLLNGLSGALDRNVRVELYLNTRYKSTDPGRLYGGEAFDVLRKKGAKIYLVDSRRIHHDKLIIVDSRYIIEGSHNWSVSALKDNSESSTLIDSPPLAREKLSRLRHLPMESDRVEREKRLNYFKERIKLPPAKDVKLKKILLENKKLFPDMVKGTSNRVMDAYLVLLAYSHGYDLEKEGEAFPVFLDIFAAHLKLPESWSRSASRRQLIKTLRILKNRYALIDVDFYHGEEAWVSLTELPGDTFTVKAAFFAPDFLASKSASGQFVILMKDLLEEEGKTLDSFTQKDLTKRFHIGKDALKTGLSEL